MFPYIDIHTHKTSLDKHTFQVYNQIIGQDKLSPNPSSAGIHPWYIDADLDQQLLLLRDIAQQEHILAIGECGLDKIAHTPWELQNTAFEKQILLANELQKPLIIHCVRAFEETIQQLQKQKAHVPILFHGINKKLPLLNSLMQKGYYVSLGAFLLQGQHDKLIETIDLTKFFLETDDKSTDIVDIYAYFCRVRNISVDLLKEQLVQNVWKVFNYKIVPQ